MPHTPEQPGKSLGPVNVHRDRFKDGREGWVASDYNTRNVGQGVTKEEALTDLGNAVDLFHEVVKAINNPPTNP